MQNTLHGLQTVTRRTCRSLCGMTCELRVVRREF